MRLATVYTTSGTHFFFNIFKFLQWPLAAVDSLPVHQLKLGGQMLPIPGEANLNKPGFHFQVKRGCESLNQISPFRCLVCLHFVSSCIPLGNLGNGNNVKTRYVFNDSGEKELASNVHVKPTVCCGCLYERPNQFWSWYVGKINETSNKVK